MAELLHSGFERESNQRESNCWVADDAQCSCGGVRIASSQASCAVSAESLLTHPESPPSKTSCGEVYHSEIFTLWKVAHAGLCVAVLACLRVSPPSMAVILTSILRRRQLVTLLASIRGIAVSPAIRVPGNLLRNRLASASLPFDYAYNVAEDGQSLERASAKMVRRRLRW